MHNNLLFGNLTLDAIPFEQPIIMGAAFFMIVVFIAAIAAITFYRKWSYIYHEWLCSVDHKKIGIMYLLLSGVMLLRGFSDAILMRSQQALAAGSFHGYLPPEQTKGNQ